VARSWCENVILDAFVGKLAMFGPIYDAGLAARYNILCETVNKSPGYAEL
jgi:hypothetical protein